jgi:hypothetical protein
MEFNVADIVVNEKLAYAPGSWDFESEVDRGFAVAFLVQHELKDGDDYAYTDEENPS